jgi:hypothetical protein
MRRAIRFELTAQTEILDALSYVESQKTGLARKLATQIHSAVEKVREHPLRYPTYFGKFQRYRVDRFQYAVVYVVEPNDTISVAGFVHLMQDPERLKKRFGG